MTSTQAQALPCPFCNGTRGIAKLELLTNGKWRVICYADMVMTAECDSSDEALRFWNRRAALPTEAAEPVPVAFIVTQLVRGEPNPDSRSLKFAPLPDYYRTENWGSPDKPMWLIEPLVSANG